MTTIGSADPAGLDLRERLAPIDRAVAEIERVLAAERKLKFSWLPLLLIVVPSAAMARSSPACCTDPGKQPMDNRKIPRVANGDLVILKGGFVSRVERVEPPDRLLVETFYPRQGLRLVPYDHILDLATRRCAPGEGP